MDYASVGAVRDAEVVAEMVLKFDTPDPIDIAVGARIRIRRRWLGLSQTQLANSIGITFQQVQKYEKGSNRVSASMLVKIAKALETSVATLVGEDGSSPVEAVVYAQLGTPGAAELLAAFARISSSESRRALLTMAGSLAEAGVKNESKRTLG